MVVRRILAEWWALLFAMAFLGAMAAYGELTNRLDARILDRAASLARAEVSEDILIVAIDDDSLAELGAWPWPRSLHAQLIDQLPASEADQVLYDVLFLEPTSEVEDDAFARAIARNGNVFLPFTFVPMQNARSGLQPAMPLPAFANAAAGMGHVTIAPDADGVLRRFAFDLKIGGIAYPHFVQSAVDADPDFDATLPSEPVMAFHPVGSYAHVSAVDVIEGRVPSEFLRDRTVLVGATAQGMGDRYSVGARNVAVMPGVETQANLLDATRSNALVRDLPNGWSAALAVFALLIQFLVFWKMSPRAGLIATLALAFAIGLLTVVLVPLAGVWIAPGAALLVVLLAYPFWSWRRLTSVSSYLEEEAAFLRPEGAQRAQVDGFDQIARQVGRMRRLVSRVNRGFQFMRKVIEAAPDAILVLDRVSHVTMANRQAQDLFPHWQEAEPGPLDELLAKHEVEQIAERGEMRFPDGRTFLVARAPFELEDDAEGGEIFALRDVTESRRRDEERREMLEFLSHDMRSPQVAIIGLARKLPDQDEEGVPERIKSQAERTLKLADDFVQLARLEETPLDFEDTDIAALIEEANDRAYALARHKRIEVDQAVPDDPVFACVDASLIARLLDNLLGNAIKFAPEGSRIDMSLRQVDDDWVQMSVADQGPGLPPERLRKPFARFGAHQSKAGPSVGLGLTFVKRVVDKHRGTINVTSGEGEGTCFIIDLPTNGSVND